MPYVFLCNGCGWLFTATYETETRCFTGPFCPGCGANDRLWLQGAERREELNGRDPFMLPRASADPDLRGLPNRSRTLGVIATQFLRLSEGVFEGDPMDDYAGYDTGHIRIESFEAEKRALLNQWGLEPREWNEMLGERLGAKWIHENHDMFCVEEETEDRIYRRRIA